MKYNFIQFTNTTVCRLCRDKKVFWKNNRVGAEVVESILIGFASVRSCGSMKARRGVRSIDGIAFLGRGCSCVGDRPAYVRYLDVILCLLACNLYVMYRKNIPTYIYIYNI